MQEVIQILDEMMVDCLGNNQQAYEALEVAKSRIIALGDWWIPTKQLPPQIDDTVLIWYYNGESYTALYKGSGVYENRMGDRYDIPDFWQPLPLPPKQ